MSQFLRDFLPTLDCSQTTIPFLLLITPGPVGSHYANHGARLDILGLILRCNPCLVHPAVYQPTLYQNGPTVEIVGIVIHDMIVLFITIIARHAGVASFSVSF